MTDANTSLDTLRRHLTAFNKTMGQDSYINLVTGLGVPGTSKSGYTWFARDRVLQPGELQNLYQSNAYATRIVDRMVDDATRSDWTLTGVDQAFDWASVKSEVDDLGALQHIGDAWRWARLHGGGLVVPALVDGLHFSEPLDLSKVQAIRDIVTLDSTNVLVRGFFAASGASAWSEPTGYQVLTPVADMGSSRVIHPSRVIRFDGCRVPAALKVVNGGWSPSVLQRCKAQLEAYGSVMGYAREILHDLSVMVVGLEGFNVMTMGDNGTANAREILRQLRWGIDNLNLLVIDKNASTYQEVRRSMEGLEKLILRFEADLVGASGMTRLILTGEQASGLGASSGDEVRSWYSSVDAERKLIVTPALNWILELVFAIRAQRGQSVPTEWSIEWAPLTTPEPKASAEIAQIWMNTAQVGIAAGIISTEQAADMLELNGVLKAVPGDPDEVESKTAPVAPLGTADPASTAQPAEPEGPTVAETALNGAQVSSLVEILAQVSAGTLAPVAAEWVIGQAVPAAVATPAKLAATKAAVEAAAAQRSLAPANVLTPEAAPATPEDEEEEEEEDHPVDVAWSNDPLPADAMTPKEAAITLNRSTISVTNLVKAGRLRQWNVLGKKQISLRDLRAIILEDNPKDAAQVLRLDPFPNEHAARQVEPSEFVQSTFHRISIAPGLEAVVGKLQSDPDGGMVVQTFRFSAEKFTPSEARAWLEAHGRRTALEVATKADRSDHSLMVSIRAPRKIAQWVPFKPDDDSPPHVTVLVCKDVDRRRADAFVNMMQAYARTLPPFTVTTGDVGYFDHEDQRVAWTGIEGAPLLAVHSAMLRAAGDLGLTCKVHEGGYTPHLTLAYLPLGEEYDGAAPPVGSPWVVDAVEVSYDDTRTVLPLTGNTPQRSTVPPA